MVIFKLPPQSKLNVPLIQPMGSFNLLKVRIVPYFLKLVTSLCLLVVFTSTSPAISVAADDAIQDASVQAVEIPTDSQCKPQMIAFRSEWCPPCNKLSPAIAKVRKSFGSRIDIIEVDVNKVENRPLLAKYAISVVPTVVFISEGGTVHIYPGATQEHLATGVRSLLKRAPRQVGQL